MYKVFNDSVHGHITLHPLCVKIINTPEFQRLRYIKQLSVADYVYPGACNTRFAHSLGVCYLAGKMVDSLKQNNEKFRKNKYKDEDEEELITDEEKLMVEIAGLCHDLGHGPFSHTWEHVVKEWDPESTWSHEEMSGKMLRHLMQENNLEEEFEDCGADIDTITGFIKGEARNLPSNKKFLSEIVSNSGSGVDVDKWDYFLRDSLHLNIHITFDYKRLLSTCTVVKDKDSGAHRIGYRDSTLFDLYEMYNCRAALHYKAYQHRVVKSVELMFIDAFEAAGEDYVVFKSHDREVKLKDAHKDENIDLYTHVTDHIQHKIQYSTDARLKKSREILMNVAKRKLYTFLGRKRVNPENLGDEKKELLKEYKKLGEKMCGELGITRVKIDMGKASDPVRNVVFYKKPNGNNADPKHIPWDNINTKLEAFPFQLSEKCPAQLLVFCKCGEKTERKHDFIKKTLQLDEETEEEEIMDK